MKKVLAFGVFDILHEGHIRYLLEAKRQGDHLTVIITPDKNVLKAKGKMPVNPESERALIVGSLKMVDKAVVGFETDFYKKTLEAYTPDVIALGYDMAEKESDLEKKIAALGLKCAVKRMPAFNPEKNKSSHIKKKIRESH